MGPAASRLTHNAPPGWTKRRPAARDRRAPTESACRWITCPATGTPSRCGYGGGVPGHRRRPGRGGPARWQAFLRRFLILNAPTLGCSSRSLGWTAPETSATRPPLTGGTWIVIACHAQLRLARFGYVGDVQSAVTMTLSYQQLLSDLSLCGPLAAAAPALRGTESVCQAPGRPWPFFSWPTSHTALPPEKAELHHHDPGRRHPLHNCPAPVAQEGPRRPSRCWPSRAWAFLLIVIPFNEMHPGPDP